MGDLKKQTQFTEGQISVKSVLIRDYGGIQRLGHPKNKANSKFTLSEVEWANCQPIVVDIVVCEQEIWYKA